MDRDSKGRFVAKQGDPAVSQAAIQRQLWEDLVVTLLERIAYNTAQTHLTYEEYLRQRVYKGERHADHSAAE